jgi:DegV family protein with EDD domain
MQQPSILLVEPDPERRKSLTFGLTAEGYEVVPAVGVAEGRRFADGLGPAVIVIAAELARDEAGDLVPAFAIHGEGRTLLLLGVREEDGAGIQDRALFLPTAGLDPSEVVRRIGLALVGREIGVEPDYLLSGLVGDFSLLSPLDLVRRLHRIQATARVEVRGGAIYLQDGELVAVRSGAARGLKAFGRLARRSDGHFRVAFGRDDHPEREMREELATAVQIAATELLTTVPNPQTRYRVSFGPQLFSDPLTPVQQEILSVLHEGGSIGRVLDASQVPDGQLLSEVQALERRGVLERLEPHPDVVIVTDSTCDLSAELIAEHRIVVVPLTIHFGEETFVDREQLEPNAFYELLARRPEHPYTNPPSPEKFALEFHRRLPRQDIVSIHISSKLSQTFANARLAAEDAQIRELAREIGKPGSLRVVDSGQVSLPLGVQAMLAARMAERGTGVDEIARRLESIGSRMRTLFLVDTLDYLAKGGRIGKARALLGKITGIKPILGVEKGEVVAIDRVRGRRSALERLVELAGRGLEAGRPTLVGIAHARAASRADRLRELIAQRLRIGELHIAEMGPVLGVHAGPGCVGATFFQPADDEAALLEPLDWESAAVSGA